MSFISERVWALMTDEERVHVRAIVDGWKFDPITNCPACGARIGMKVRLTTSAVHLDAPDVAPPTTDDAPPWLGRLPLAEQRVLAEAQATGLLAAFEAAVQEEKGAMSPKNVPKFLLEFLATARVDMVPRFILDEYGDQFEGRLEFYSAQGIFAVVVDGVTRAFFPKSRMEGQRLKRSVPGQMAARFQSNDRMVEWIRGKFGYVPRDAKLFGAAMRQPNKGKFGTLVQ